MSTRSTTTIGHIFSLTQWLPSNLKFIFLFLLMFNWDNMLDMKNKIKIFLITDVANFTPQKSNKY